MTVSALMTFLSAVSKVIKPDGVPKVLRRVHFLNSDNEPSSFFVDEQLLLRFKEECILGDLVDVSISIRTSSNGTFMQIVDFKKSI